LTTRTRQGTVHPLARLGYPPDTGGLGEGEAAPTQGPNDFGTVGYRGPCPPQGHRRHRYHFRLHAVTGDLGLAPGAGVQALERAMAANVLAVAELVGTYQR
jgi:Raf kinase inhibitor-like YbhB/YbcL family protein